MNLLLFHLPCFYSFLRGFTYAASVCLNMWSAGRGTLNGDNPRATGPLEVLLRGWVEAGWICMWDACMTWLSRQKLALATGEGFGKVSRGFPTPHHTLSVCGHFATFSAALATKNYIFKVKVVKRGEKTQTKKPTHKKRKKVAFCTSENPGYNSLKLEPPKQGFASGEALEALQSYGEPSFQS